MQEAGQRPFHANMLKPLPRHLALGHIDWASQLQSPPQNLQSPVSFTLNFRHGRFHFQERSSSRRGLKQERPNFFSF